MALTEVLIGAKALPRVEQLRLIQELVAGLLHTEATEPNLEPGGEYPVWSPHSAYEAADTLLRMLAESEARP